ncbi:MAG: creatininase family protein [Pirellulaceae bacterium]|nr:creatininase family protein [Pirellulaceae bacterium]
MSTPCQLRKLTRREFRERMDSGELKACILPVAAIEQHLEHLAMEHDWRSVTAVALQVAQNLSPSVLVAEALMVGISEHHMNHPGTLTLRPGTFLAVLNDLIRSLTKAGFTNILVLNGHGGNMQPCQAVWDQFVREFQINLEFFSYWDVLNESDAVDLLKSGHRLPDDLPGHAQEFETAIAMSEFGENVRESAMRSQADQTPTHATQAQGAEFMERIVERLTEHLEKLIRGERKIKVPAFHP